MLNFPISVIGTKGPGSQYNSLYTKLFLFSPQYRTGKRIVYTVINYVLYRVLDKLTQKCPLCDAMECTYNVNLIHVYIAQNIGSAIRYRHTLT